MSGADSKLNGRDRLVLRKSESLLLNWPFKLLPGICPECYSLLEISAYAIRTKKGKDRCGTKRKMKFLKNVKQSLGQPQIRRNSFFAQGSL